MLVYKPYYLDDRGFHQQLLSAHVDTTCSGNIGAGNLQNRLASPVLADASSAASSPAPSETLLPAGLSLATTIASVTQGKQSVAQLRTFVEEIKPTTGRSGISNRRPTIEAMSHSQHEGSRSDSESQVKGVQEAFEALDVELFKIERCYCMTGDRWQGRAWF
jgi:hypothetical protein